MILLNLNPYSHKVYLRTFCLGVPYTVTEHYPGIFIRLPHVEVSNGLLSYSVDKNINIKRFF